MKSRREMLVESFRDTMRQVKENPSLAEKTRQAQAGTVLYLPGYESYRRREKSRDLLPEVVEDTTFHAAQRLLEEKAGGRTAVLNFANAYYPGGGVANGAMAQEECLCRSSSLYSALTVPYLIRNYYKDNKRTTGDLGTDKVIWTPGITVFKNDDTIPAMLEHPFEVDVLTCAAPYYDVNRKHPVPLSQLEDVFYHRILNILEAAVANDVDNIVLGAFGCGAFNNPPALVAEAFHRVLMEKQYRNQFRRIVFAIKKNDRDNTNLLAFRQVLQADSVRFTGLVNESLR